MHKRKLCFSSSKKSKSCFPQNEIFNRFLTQENVYDVTDKYNILKSPDIIPSYSNINKQINKKINEINNCAFEKPILINNKIKNTYSFYKKGFSNFFFGPKLDLLNFINKSHLKQKKINFNSKMIKGTLDLYTISQRYNSYTGRFKSKRKIKSEVNKYFEKVDTNTISRKKHSNFFRKKNKKKQISNLSENKIKNQDKYNNKNLTIVQDNKTKNIIRNKNFYFRPNKNDFHKIISKNLYNRNKEKNINILRENNKKFKQIMYSKIEDTEIPSNKLKQNLIYFYMQNNRVRLKAKNNNDKHKQDIKLIGEFHKKESNDYSDLKELRQKLSTISDKKDINNKFAPRRIHFSYYETIESRSSVLDLIKKIGEKKEEKKNKNGKNVREQFFRNWNMIAKLNTSLDKMRKRFKSK